MSAKSRKRRKRGRGGPSDSAADDPTLLPTSRSVDPGAISKSEPSPAGHSPSQPPSDPPPAADLGLDDADLGLGDEILLAFLRKNGAEEGSLVPVSSSHLPTQAWPPDGDSPVDVDVDLDTLLPNPEVEQRRRHAQRLAAGVLAFAGLLGVIALARGSEQPRQWPNESSRAATRPELPANGVTAATSVALPANAAAVPEAQELASAATSATASTAAPSLSAEHAMFEDDAGTNDAATVTPAAEMVVPSAR